ncbi:MAG: hypothetical protein IPI20_21115 [Rhodoferax sp.]|nr:hypothetical protein [Rhodoferax sp.]
MAGNDFVVTDLVAREALKIAHEKLAFIGTVDRQYDASFSGDPKHGATLRVMSPNKYTRRQGSRILNAQAQSEVSQTITVATQDGVDMSFNSDELALITPDNIGRVQQALHRACCGRPAVGH